MQWTAGRPDGMIHPPDGWQGTEFSDLQTVQNLLETLLNNGIPVKKHHYDKVILSNRMRPITNKQTPHLAILGQKSLDRLKIQSRSKNKNYSPFFSQRDKG
jgi:hypothetical protein